MNYLILTTRSPKIRKLCTITYKNKRTYAKLWGYFTAEIEFSDEPDGYGKGYVALLEGAKRILKAGYGVMQMDADAVFTNDNIRIEDRIKRNDAIVVACEPQPNCIVNGGVKLYQPWNSTHQFIDLLLQHRDEWINDPLVIQGWVAKHIDLPIMSNLRVVPSSEMNSLTKERPEFPHTNPNEVWQTGDWIAHAYGWPIEDKISQICNCLAHPRSKALARASC